MSRHPIAACEGHAVYLDATLTGLPVVRCEGMGCRWSATNIADRSLVRLAGLRHITEQRRKQGKAPS